MSTIVTILVILDIVNAELSMTVSLSQIQKRTLLAVSVTGFVAACLVVLVPKLQFNNWLAFGFTFDFVCTVPLLYFILIRKTNIPAITVVPLSLLMLLLASWLIPQEFQFYVVIYRNYALPVLELLVLAILVIRIRRAGLAYRTAGAQADVCCRLQQAASEVLPAPKQAASILATEAAMIYYAHAFFKKKKGLPGFTYHRETALFAVMGAFMLLIVVETLALHLLLMQWSALAANVVSVLSIYSFVYLLAIAGAARHRPHLISTAGLQIRFGLQESLIPLEQIRSMERLRGDVPEGKEVASLGMLGNFNMIMSVAEPQTLQGLYGLRRQYKTLAFWVDDPEAFLRAYAEAVKE